MNPIRTSMANLLAADMDNPLGDHAKQPLSVRTVERSEYESACRSLGVGEVVVTRECTGNFAVADFIRVAPVIVKDVVIGKIHLRFYKHNKKVKRNFVCFDSQVRKLLGKRRERIALPMVDWLGDTSDVLVMKILGDTVQEIVRLCLSQPTNCNASASNQSTVSTNTKKVPDQPRVERPVEVKPAQVQGSRSMESVAAMAVLQDSVDREAKGAKQVGVVTEMGKTFRQGANGGFNSFCLKLDVNGTHIPFYGVELERECAERGVKAGQVVEVIDMGKQALPGGRHKNLFRINILRGKK